MANLIPVSKPIQQKSSIVKIDKFLPRVKSSAIVPKNFQSNSKGILSESSILFDIEKKVIKIDTILKDFLLTLKKQNEKKRKQDEIDEFKNREKDLEKTKPKEVKKIELPPLPQVGIFGFIKNFIIKTVLGFLAVRLIDYLPKLLKILPVVIKVTDFITDIGGKMLDGLVTFIDWGYKDTDGTRKFIKNIGGEGWAKTFDKFSSALSTMLDVAIIATMSVVSMSGDDGGGGSGTGGNHRRGFDSYGRRVSKSAQRRYFERYGKTQFLERFGKEGLENLPSAMRRGAIEKFGRRAFVGMLGKGGAKTVLGFVRPLLKRIPIPVFGALIDFGLSWALGEDPGRAAFKAIGASILGIIGSGLAGALGLAGGPLAIATAALGGLAGGALGDMAGGALYDLFFGKKKPQGKVAKAAGGGIPNTRGGKLVGGSTKRAVKRKKAPRTLTVTTSKVRPGASVGGEKKIKQLFPDPNTDKSKGKGKDSGRDKMNPFEFLKNTHDKFSKSTGLGAIIALAIKPILGDRPSFVDYKNAAIGINNWMNTTFSSGSYGYAGGGEVKMESIISGDDYSNVIAKSLQESITPQVDKTLQDLMKNLAMRPVGREEMIQENIKKGTEPEERFEVGPAGSSGDKLTMARNLMRDLGLTAAQAAGIVGNMDAESGVENARIQGSPPGTKGVLKVDGKTGYGLVQWTSIGRQQALADFARSKGADLSKPLSMDIEYQFFLKEFKGAYGHVLKQIKDAPDTKTASTIFMQQYEVPEGHKTEAKIIERYNKSKPIFDRLSRGEGKATEGRGTFIASETTNGSGKFKVIEYITGDRNHPNLDVKGHGLPSNYHDHIAFATVAEKERAKRALRAAGIQIGSENDGRHAVGSYHYKNLAIDIPGHQWGGSGAIGSREFAGSKKVRSILGIGMNAPRFHGGPVLKTGMLLAHKGEFVIDKDSVDLFGIDLIDSINRIENKSQLITKAPSIIEKLKAISGYADYEQSSGSEIVLIPISSQDSSSGFYGGGKSSVYFIGGSIDNSISTQISDSLMYG